MATVEVFHKAASVHSSSIITDSFVASFQQSFFRASIEVWQKAFLKFIDSQLRTAAQLAHLM